MRSKKVSTPTISRAEVKQAILAANIEHGDVALRALAAVDSDLKFCQAVEAVIEVDDDEHTKLHKLVTAQFKPGEQHDYFEYGERGIKAKRDAILKDVRKAKGAKLPEVVALLNEQALVASLDMLSDASIKEVIERQITAKFATLVAAILGIREDYDRIEVDYQKESTIRSKFAQMVSAALDGPVRKALAGIDLHNVYKKHEKQAIKALRDAYQEAFDEGLQQRIEEVATKKAETDLDKLFARIEAEEA